MDHPSPSSAAGHPARLRSLDSLRGLCALIVFLSHWHLWSNFTPRGVLEKSVHGVLGFFHEAFVLLAWPTGGHHPAVIAFFVLSGFCIHYPFERRAHARAEAVVWRDYFRRRFLRIMPVYWSACAAGLLFVAAETLLPAGSPLLQLHARASVEDVLVRFAGLAGLYPREIFAGNYILTTVAVEMLMYAAYPLFHRYAARGQWAALGGAFLALHALAIALLPFVTPFWVFNSIFMLGIFWYAGALGAHLFLAQRARVRGRWLLLAWALFLALKVTPHFYGLNLLKQAAWGLVCALGILWLLQRETLRPPGDETPRAAVLRRLGDASYSLYAMHTPAIMLATWALLHAGLTNYFVQLAATLFASLALVLIVHLGVERRCYRPRTVEPSAPGAGALPAASRTAPS